MAVYAYLRVSRDEQNENSQRQGVDDFAKQHNWNIDRYVIDHGASGALDFDKRNIKHLMQMCESGDVIIASEISRIGRRLQLVLDFIQFCTDAGVSLYTVKDRYKISDDIQSKVLVTVMGLCAELERDLIRQRTKEGLARAKKEGRALGRPKGSLSKHRKLDKHRDNIKAMLTEGVSQNEIARRLCVSKLTVDRYLRQCMYSECTAIYAGQCRIIEDNSCTWYNA